MNPLPRWMAFASFPAVLALKMSATHAFTDTNAELKEAAAERAAPPVLAVRPVAVPVRTAWVPTSAKALDGFRPVFPKAPMDAPPGQATLLARADAPASAARR